MKKISTKPRGSSITKKKSIKKETIDAMRSLLYTLSFLTVALLVLFLFTSNENSLNGQTIQQLEKEREVLNKEHQKLMYQITESTAVNRIEEDEKVVRMEEMNDKVYVTTQDNQVASSKEDSGSES